MSKSISRKPLAAAALFATSVGAVALAPAASATTAGTAPSPFTISDGGTAVQVVGGTAVTAPAGATDVAWSHNGARFAYVNNGAVYSADYDGTHQVLVAAADGTQRSHLVWDAAGQFVVWSEGGQLMRALGDGTYAQKNWKPIPLLTGDAAKTSGSGDQWPDVAGDGTVVFQRDTGIVAVHWDAQNNQVITKVADNAQQPTISPDGKTVAFVRSVSGTGGTATQVFTAPMPAVGAAPAAATQITFPAAGKAANHSGPKFSADGKTIAFTLDGADKGTYTVAAVPATALANPETKISDSVGTIGVRTDAQAKVIRFAGTDRVDTAIKASQAMWADTGATDAARGQAASAVLSRSDLFADALGGAALAAHNNGPLLLANTTKIEQPVLDELHRILKPGSTVYVLGGTNALSAGDEQQIKAAGFIPQRINGQNRYETAADIAAKVTSTPKRVLVATGDNFADALSGGAVAAGHQDTVVVLSAGMTGPTGTMPTSTATYLRQAVAGGAQISAIGWQAVHALDTSGFAGQFTREAGDNRFETSRLVAQDLFGGMTSVGIATGTNWADALSGGAFMGKEGGPLVLVDPAGGVSEGTNDLIDANRGAISDGFVFGGTAALGSKFDTKLGDDIKSATGVQVDAPAPGSGSASGR